MLEDGEDRTSTTNEEINLKTLYITDMMTLEIQKKRTTMGCMWSLPKNITVFEDKDKAKLKN